MNAYASHLPVLQLLFDKFKFKTVLELGIGEASTPFFLRQGVILTSVETDVGWAIKYSHDIVVGSALDFIRNDPRTFDLAFIDSNPGNERHKCVELLFGKADIIVVHDTEPESDWNYDFTKIILPDGYSKLDFKEEVPWTSIYSLGYSLSGILVAKRP